MRLKIGLAIVAAWTLVCLAGCGTSGGLPCVGPVYCNASRQTVMDQATPAVGDQEVPPRKNSKPVPAGITHP